MDKKRQSYFLGLVGEFFALTILFLSGYFPIKRRYKSIAGEIDLVMARSNQIIFFEIKTRLRHRDGYDIVGQKQILRIKKSSEVFLSNYHQKYKNIDHRFDLIYLSLLPLPKFIHIKNI